jgi:peroxiredoxin (alkyl hydroperoxide reductase subunit C)
MFVHKVWVDTELSKMITAGTVPFPMLSDSGGKIGEVYGVYDHDNGVDVRGRFLIDPDGVIQGYEVLSPPVGRNVSETLRQIQAFQHVRATQGGEATPSGWKPGKATLKPGPQLVGKVWEEWKVQMAFD